MDEKILEALMKNAGSLAEATHFQQRHTQEFDFLRNKVDENTKQLASLQAQLKGVSDTLESERKLNRDRQLDISKLIDDKIETLYKWVSIIATIISLFISFVHSFITK